MSITVFIDGAAGTTGLEIGERLAGRPEIEPVVLDDSQRKDPAARREALNASDFAMLCLPDDAAREAVALIDPASKIRVIDASTAHRTAAGWAYGFPEITGREAVANAARVSNPGCYPTGFIGLVAPLVRAGLISADWRFTCNAVSGYSGGGKALVERLELTEPGIAFRSYGLDLAHKHQPEMKQHAGLAHEVIFAPAVVPAYRGMVVEVPLHLGAIDPALTAARLREELHAFYSGSTIVTVSNEPGDGEILLRRDTPPHDGMVLHVFGDAGGSHARLVAVLDNLGKGASGAAIQNLNLMAGLPETAGLMLGA